MLQPKFAGQPPGPHAAGCKTEGSSGNGESLQLCWLLMEGLPALSDACPGNLLLSNKSWGGDDVALSSLKYIHPPKQKSQEQTAKEEFAPLGAEPTLRGSSTAHLLMDISQVSAYATDTSRLLKDCPVLIFFLSKEVSLRHACCFLQSWYKNRCQWRQLVCKPAPG